MRLRIEKEVYGGDGLAHDESGAAVFVPFVLPGELAAVELTRKRGHTARTSLVQIEEASAERVVPRCKHFGRCGGCQYQHVSYEHQLSIKQEILDETLRRAGLDRLPQIAVHSSEPWFYRNRIRLRVERAVDGAIQVGYNLRESREFLPIEQCPIAAPVLWRAASALLELSAAYSACLDDVAEIELFATADQKWLQTTFFVRHERAAVFADLCESLRERVPELAGAGVVLVSSAGTRTRAGASWGKPGFFYRTAEREYWVSRGGFFQVNRFLVDELVRLVTSGRKGFIAWDLFAGVGLFSRVLAERFERVVAVEANAGAIRDLASAKVKNIEGLAMTAEAFLRGAVVGRERPDLVVMDPPRAGVGKAVCGLLARLQVPQIVYVSCDPTTLARDLKVMVDSGYNLAELHLVDLFPQTFHLETVTILRRCAR